MGSLSNNIKVMILLACYILIALCPSCKIHTFLKSGGCLASPWLLYELTRVLRVLLMLYNCTQIGCHIFKLALQRPAVSVSTDTALTWELLMTSKFSPQLITFFLGGVVLFGNQSHMGVLLPLLVEELIYSSSYASPGYFACAPKSMHLAKKSFFVLDINQADFRSFSLLNPALHNCEDYIQFQHELPSRQMAACPFHVLTSPVIRCERNLALTGCRAAWRPGCCFSLPWWLSQRWGLNLLQ